MWLCMHRCLTYSMCVEGKESPVTPCLRLQGRVSAVLRLRSWFPCPSHRRAGTTTWSPQPALHSFQRTELMSSRSHGEYRTHLSSPGLELLIPFSLHLGAGITDPQSSSQCNGAGDEARASRTLKQVLRQLSHIPTTHFPLRLSHEEVLGWSWRRHYF